MVQRLVLTRKYQILEYRDDDENIMKEFTDDATTKAFDALKEMGFRRSNLIFSDRVGDLQYDDFIFYLSDVQLATLKESVNLDGFDLKEVDD